jgi:hypothetical protein
LPLSSAAPIAGTCEVVTPAVMRAITPTLRVWGKRQALRVIGRIAWALLQRLQ